MDVHVVLACGYMWGASLYRCMGGVRCAYFRDDPLRKGQAWQKDMGWEGSSLSALSLS